MSDFQSSLKRTFSGLNTFRILFILSFIFLGATFVIYSFFLEGQGREKMRQVYALRDNLSTFESLTMEIENNVDESYLNSVKFLTEGKDIYLYRAVEDMGEINTTYNKLFVASRSIDREFIPKAILLKNTIYQYEKELLKRLSEEKPVQNVEISPIISDRDTLEQNLDDLFAEDEDGTLEEDDFMSDESAPEETANSSFQLGLGAVDMLQTSLKNQLYELNILLESKIEGRAREEVEKGVVPFGVILLFLMVVLLLLVLSFFVIRKLLTKKMDRFSEQLKTISQGQLPEKLETQKDEFDDVVVNSNELINYLDGASKFALKIGDGDFNYQFHARGTSDQLGNALIQMRERLQKVAAEDKMRNWINEGQAKFGEILRNTGDDFEELGNKIVSNLVDYLDANQGVLYVKEELSEDRIQLNLLSAYAFKRKKHLERKIEPGEGLIGQAFDERKTMFLKEVNSDHFNIVTGLGESKPSSVLIVPLKNENDIEGVIEIASFGIFQDYQISFVEKLGESIASSIRAGKVNATTKHLLAEMQTREEEMRAQEEELKQNMEELSATQEQLERLRKEDESRKLELENKRGTLYDILNNSGSLIYVKDEDGKFVYVNQVFADHLEKSIDAIVNKESHKVLDADIDSFRKKLEKQAVEDNIVVTQTDESTGKNLMLSPFHIRHLDKPGVLGVLR